MKNLTMCPFTPYVPSLHCSVELNPSGQGQMDIPDGFFFSSQQIVLLNYVLDAVMVCSPVWSEADPQKAIGARGGV